MGEQETTTRDANDDSPVAFALTRVFSATAVTRSRTGTSVVPCRARQSWMNLRHLNARRTTCVMALTDAAVLPEPTRSPNTMSTESSYGRCP